MKERPILFSTEMVSAILAGRKTQTRRIVKDQELINDLVEWHEPGDGEKLQVKFSEWCLEDEDKIMPPEWIVYFDEECCMPLGKGPGEIGDLLWIRESHFVTWDNNHNITVLFRDGVSIRFYYKHLPLNTIKNLRKRKSLNKSWVPGRFMPKAFARIWIQIENVKVERLQNITENDAKAEGVSSYHPSIEMKYRFGYSELWDRINNPTASDQNQASWDSNPWVWAITFKVLSTNGKPAIQEMEVVNG